MVGRRVREAVVSFNGQTVSPYIQFDHAGDYFRRENGEGTGGVMATRPSFVSACV
ncbi:hypothetical protein D3C71_2028380 [compost metagenome]